MRTAHIRARNRQAGAVTLLVTLLIMVAITVGSFAMLNTSTVESRMTANDRRSKEALQAAQAGVDFVLANLALSAIDLEVLCAPRMPNQAEDTPPSPPYFELNFSGPDASGVLDFSEQEVATCKSMPFSLLTKISVWSRGYSNDGESVRTVLSTIDLTTPWEWNYRTRTAGGGGGTAPLVAKGDVDFRGTPEVSLCETMKQCKDLARPGNQDGLIEGTLVMAGGEITQGGSVPMSEGNYDANNPTLAGLSANDLFSQFVSGGLSMDAFKLHSGTHEFTPPSTGGNGNNDNAVSTALTATNKNQIFVNGDLTLRNGTIGSPEKPVILAVEGSLNLAGNVTIWGVVYATEADFSAGTNTIMGSLVTAGNVNMKGTASIHYNADLRPVPEEYDPDDAAAGYESARTSSVRLGSWREVRHD